jgi:uncharacterized membrane protein
MYFPYIFYVALFMFYITILCLFKAQYVQYEGNNLKKENAHVSVALRNNVCNDVIRNYALLFTLYPLLFTHCLYL